MEETIVIAVESQGNGISEANQHMAEQLNRMVGERVSDGYFGHVGGTNYVVAKVVFVTNVIVQYNTYHEVWEIYALAVVAVAPL